jgi:spermidine/putrescine transport system substrate-binding protein/spermidine/putrescine transport system permease protein
MPHPNKPRTTAAPLAMVTGLVYMFLYAPIAVLIALSFNNSRFSTVWQGFTWHWYAIAWRDGELIASLRNSLIVAFFTTTISVAIGTAAGYALARYRFRLKSAAEALVFLPVVIPEIVVGFATAAFFGLTGIAFGLATIIGTHIAFSISYVTFIVRARTAVVDRSYDEAAMDLGATPWQAFRTVTLPMIGPGVVSAALLVFTISLDDYVITSFVAGPGSATLPVKIYSMVKTGVTPEINAISSILLAVTLLLVLVSERISAGARSRAAILFGAAGILALLVFAVGGGGRTARGGELNIYIWSNYLPEQTVAEFEKRYDARVNVELYDSNEALLAKLQSGSAAFDIVVPSDYMVTVLRAQKLLQPIDRDLITNFSNLDPQFVGLPYDQRNEWSIPYGWGTTGIAYRKDKVETPAGWAALWDRKYKERIAMLDDVREVFGAALKLMGKSLNSANPNDLENAARLLSDQKPLVRAYDSGGFDQLLLSGDVWLAQAYSGNIVRAMGESPLIGYVIPKEGCTFFVDNLCIPKSATNPELAHAFINYVLEPRVAAAIANVTGFSSPNVAARALIRPDLLTNPAAYPTREALEHCELIEEIGPEITLYDRLWTVIKSK